MSTGLKPTNATIINCLFKLSNFSSLRNSGIFTYPASSFFRGFRIDSELFIRRLGCELLEIILLVRLCNILLTLSLTGDSSW